MSDFISESERHYISLLQENINRMASNSANCKTWLVTLVTAMLAIQITAEELRNILWIALGLIFIFYLLDSYYLSLERKFRVLEKEFVNKVMNKEDDLDVLYSFDIENVTDVKATFKNSLVSVSTIFFYLPLFIIILIICLWPYIILFFNHFHGS